MQGTEYERFTDRFREFIQLLEEDPDSRFVRYTAWLEVYSYATDDATRQRAIEEILRVGGKVLQGEDGELYFEPPPQE
ncbi:MAG: hypothetical protein HC925_04360 [Coleofasciculaceae cyanobacterium SM2_3_26]|nr:hypothetical protein [Coleofasciculaceae cyanobacterium SM2_3_26]